jgi:hypothetical protein
LTDLLAAARTVPCARPELTCLLVLAELLTALADLHAEGKAHGILAPGLVLLGGASPARLLAECPRDPAVRLVGAGMGSPCGGHGAPSAEGDLRAAGALAAALLAAQSAWAESGAREPEAVTPRLAGLLAVLQSPRSRGRATAREAASLGRELALQAMAGWERSRPDPLVDARPIAGLRYSPAAPWHLVGAAHAGNRRDGGRAAAPCDRERRGSWLALAPSLLAGLLAALLGAVLMLGS